MPWYRSPVATADSRRRALRGAPWVLLLMVSCESVLGLEQPVPRSECLEASCSEAGAGGEAGTMGGTASGSAASGGTAATADELGGTGGNRDGGAPGEGGQQSGRSGRGGSATAGRGSSSGTGGEAGDSDEGGAGASGGFTNAGTAGSSGGDATACEPGALRCNAYQPEQCNDGVWSDAGDECTGYCQDGVCKEARSCAPGTTTTPCASNASCCDTIWIPGGTYEMGKGDVEDPDLSYPRTVGDYYLDRFEVTVGRFEAFITAYSLPQEGVGAHPRIPMSGWRKSWESLPDWDHSGETAVPPTSDALEAQVGDLSHCKESSTYRENDQTLPINCVNWYVAFAFCVFDGGRLPTEAEWNYAAAFGDHQRPYPWSQSIADVTIDTSRASYHAPPDPVPLLPSPVGSHPSGQGGYYRNTGQGHEDLAGNVMEWVADQWSDAPPASCGTDCMVPWPDLDDERVVRGGGFPLVSQYLRSGARSSSVAYNVDNLYGFRCARDSSTEQ